MSDILHRVGIAAAPGAVFRALATLEGIAGWWITSAEGQPGIVGAEWRFRFATMRVLELQPGKLVRWRCVAGPEEWLGTEICFELRRARRQTWVMFSHRGWQQPGEFMHHCSTKWAVFLLSLKEYVETGAGRPAPHDRKIHVGE